MFWGGCGESLVVGHSRGAREYLWAGGIQKKPRPNDGPSVKFWHHVPCPATDKETYYYCAVGVTGSNPKNVLEV